MFGSKKIAELENQVLTQKHKYEQSETDKLELEKKITQLKKEKEDLDAEVLSLAKEKSELEQAKRDWEKEKKDLDSEVLTLTKEKAELEKEKSALEKEKDGLEQEKAALAEQLEDRDLEELRHQAKATLAEYEGLKELYARKIQEFDASREGKEAEFARQAAMDRFNLENEISENRRANEEFVSSTVQTFSETFNYYLNQIRLLTDALGKVASETGGNLFSADLEHLRANFGHDMISALKSETVGLQEDSGNRILIGSSEDASRDASKEDAAENSESEETSV